MYLCLAKKMAVVARRLSDQFQQHKQALHALQKRKIEDVQLTSLIHDNRERRTKTTYGQKQPGDIYKGDIALRDLKNILIAFDQNGCALPPSPLCRLPSHSTLPHTDERSENQVLFHDSFMRSTARVLYSADWRTAQPAIMEKNGWGTCPSEIMVRALCHLELAVSHPGCCVHRSQLRVALARRSGACCLALCDAIAYGLAALFLVVRVGPLSLLRSRDGLTPFLVLGVGPLSLQRTRDLCNVFWILPKPKRILGLLVASSLGLHH